MSKSQAVQLLKAFIPRRMLSGHFQEPAKSRYLSPGVRNEMAANDRKWSEMIGRINFSWKSSSHSLL